MKDAEGSVPGIDVTAKDITACKQMASELKASQQRLQEPSRKSIRALEKERQSVAKKLHDRALVANGRDKPRRPTSERRFAMTALHVKTIEAAWNQKN